MLPTWLSLQPAASSCSYPGCRRPAPLPGVEFPPFPPSLLQPPPRPHPPDTDTQGLLLRCLRIPGGGRAEDGDACGARTLWGSGRGPGGGSAAGAAGAALQKGRRMGRSWGAGGRGRRGLKRRRAQVGLPRSLAIGDAPTSATNSLPPLCPAPSGAPDPSTVSAARRPGRCGHRGCWEEGDESAGPEEVSRI